MSKYRFFIRDNSKEKLELLKYLMKKNIMECNNIDFSIIQNKKEKYWELDAILEDQSYCLQLSLYANGVFDSLNYLGKIFK